MERFADYLGSSRRVLPENGKNFAMIEIPKAFQGLTVMVTGASGFIGSHLTARLASSGIQVNAVSRTDRSGVGGTPATVWWKCDLEDLEEVRRLFDKVRPDIVYHLSGNANGPSQRELVMPTFRSLTVSALNILMVATDMGCKRIVLPGTFEEPDIREGDNIPGSPYAAAKQASSQYALMFHRLYGTPVVLPIPFMSYGPGHHPHKLIPYTILSLLGGNQPRLGSGNRLIDWIYIDDLVEGMLYCGHVPGVEGMRLDLGSGILTSIRDVVKTINRIVDPSIAVEFGAVPDRAMEKTQIADVASTRSHLSWSPTVPLEEGLFRTVEWYRSGKR